MRVLVNLAIMGLFPLFLYKGYNRNLFQSAVLLGRCFFAFIVSMGFFAELADVFRLIPGLVDVYAGPAAFVVLWVGVWLFFEKGLRSILKNLPERIEFSYDKPGKIGLGLACAFFTASALGAMVTMIPFVEGMYFLEDASPALDIQRRGQKVYRLATFSVSAPVASFRMDAGGYWLKKKIEESRPEEYEDVKKLYDRFQDRYRRAAVETDRSQQRRTEWTKKLQKALEQLEDDFRGDMEEGDEEEGEEGEEGEGTEGGE